MDSLLKRARRVYTPPQTVSPLWAWRTDSHLIGLEGKRLFDLDPDTGKKTTKPLPRLTNLDNDRVVFSPGGGWLLALQDGKTLGLQALSLEGKPTCVWKFAAGLHHATPPLWIEQGTAWVFLAYKPLPKENGAELFALTGKREEPGKYRTIPLGRSQKKVGCFAPEEFQGPYGPVHFDLGTLTEGTEGDMLQGVRGTFHFGEHHKLFRYSLRLSQGASSRQDTPIPFPERGMFQEAAYSPASQRVATFLSADRNIEKPSLETQIELHTLNLDGSEPRPLGSLVWKLPDGPIPRQLTWLPGGKKLSFEFQGSVYVLDAV